MPNYHVIKNSKSGDWTVKKAGSDRASGSFGKQSTAEKAAKRFAANTGGGEVRIHDRNGKIRDSDTVPPANDPNPPRDKRH
ncbi:MAG: DUF2188 domain-containing protein [Candidatus Sungbacteria bacterium]|nr:DUF2188 domain-containing protein [Candidatus Sungbacteria bacterium]